MMKKRHYLLSILGVGVLASGGYWFYKSTAPDIQALYPRTKETFVGDPMPYYNGKEFMIYYLEDLRDGQIGFHPYSLLKTKDFYNYRHTSSVIPFVNEEDSKEKALGTGSILQIDGKYHAFYTGHNGDRQPKEVIMHATSKDGVTFDKDPEDTFMASSAYEANDFRDPYVFWEENSKEYWMLITTRKDGKGVIAKYTSKDAKTWQDSGVFFENDLGNDSNLECPSLVYYQGKWILAFSDQWDKRVVHYRIADKPDGPFIKPKGTDHVDGAGFYAGRLETDGNHLYLVGWIPTKEGHSDEKKYNWAGNLAIHQLSLNRDRLFAEPPKSAISKLTKSTFPKKSLSKGESVALDTEKSLLFSGKMTVGTRNTKLAFQFGDANHVILDMNEESIYYSNNKPELATVERAVTQMPVTLNNNELDITIIKEQDIVVIYVNGVALSNRMYVTDDTINIMVLDGNVTIK